METVSRGIRLHFSVRGAGPPVLLVHGFPLSGELWDGVVPYLEKDFRLIVPDLRGHGRSEPAEEGAMEDHAQDLLAVLDAADESRPVVLVGMSMGGYVSLAFCRRSAGRVRALALVDSRAAADAPEAAAARRRTAEQVLAEGGGFVADDMVEKLFAPSASRDLRDEWRARMAATPSRGIAAALRGMADRPDSEDLMRSLGLPLLVVVGEEDRITPVAEARALAAGTGAALEVIPGAGHIAPVEAPEAVAAALRRFLEAIE